MTKFKWPTECILKWELSKQPFPKTLAWREKTSFPSSLPICNCQSPSLCTSYNAAATRRIPPPPGSSTMHLFSPPKSRCWHIASHHPSLYAMHSTRLCTACTRPGKDSVGSALAVERKPSDGEGL